MILLAGIPTEPPVALAAASAAALGLPCLVLNQRAFVADDLDLRFADGVCSGSLTVAGQRHPLDRIAGIYLRTMDADSLPEVQEAPRTWQGAQTAMRARAWEETLHAWAEVAPQRVANRVSFTLSNFSKPCQTQAIRAAGFAVPDTLVTNDPDAVRRFHARHGRVIYKSASSVRSIVRLLDDAALAKLDAIRTLPTQFQAYVAGDDVRVHVVGTRTFAARIVSDAVDYRYAARDGLDVDMAPFDLPDDVAARCVALACRLGLPFCGIDFKVSAGGDYVCFEVNPSPAYSYYQELTGAPISDALVRYLAGHA